MTKPTKTAVEKFGEFIGFSIAALIFLTILALAGLAWFGIYVAFVWLAGAL